jgi:hypothetical protein
VLFQETGDESSQTAVNVQSNVVFVSNFTDLFDRVDDSVREVRVRRVESDGVRVNERLHVFDIDLVFAV